MLFRSQYVAGMTMGVENSDKGMQSNVIFLQDRFSIMNGAGGKPNVIFTTNGDQVIIKDTAIGNGSITNAKIGNIIQSDNFKEGVSGWQLSKNEGKLKAVNADISGKLKATSGELNNVVINDTCKINKLKVDQIEGDVLKCVYLNANQSITVPPTDYDRNIFLHQIFITTYGYNGECLIKINNIDVVKLYVKGYSYHPKTSKDSDAYHNYFIGIDQGSFSHFIPKWQSLKIEYLINNLTFKKNTNGNKVAAIGFHRPECCFFTYPKTLCLLVTKN